MMRYDKVFNAQLQAAFDFASKAHDGQMRGDGVTPYVFHCADVAKRIEQSWPGSHHAIIAGMLHDTVEDTAVTVDDIDYRFGWRVANIVAAVTDPPGLRGEDRHKRQLSRISLMGNEALMVKWADKMSNLNDIIRNPPKWSAEKIERNKGRMNLQVELLMAEICERGLSEAEQ